MVKLICGIHNHELAKSLVDHPYVGQLTKEEKIIVAIVFCEGRGSFLYRLVFQAFVEVRVGKSHVAYLNFWVVVYILFGQLQLTPQWFQDEI